MLGSFIVNSISLSPNASFEEAFSVAGRRLRSLGVSLSEVFYSIYKRSIDARKKNDVRIVYSVRVSCSYTERDAALLVKAGIKADVNERPVALPGSEPLCGDIIVVGSGPAGLFATLFLAEQGYFPTMIERGGSISERQAAVESFRRTRVLDPDTNIQFGAGGAGTFSDGKLITRIGDPLSSYVLDKLVEFGAPSEIRFQARPHIGTDILSSVVQRISDRITDLGGRVLYNTKMLDIISEGGRITSIKTSRADMPCDALVLATGHSARDTYEMLMGHGVDMVAKSFSVGMRIEHPVDFIDSAFYGDFAGHPALGHAEYNLSYNTKVRGVYTFCMCPGGTVISAASEFGGVVVNGMSEHARSGRNSNSAVCCTVFKEDFGSDPRGAIDFQRRIERMAYTSAGSDYSAPICTLGDLLDGKFIHEPSSVTPTYADAISVKIADPRSYFPDFVVDNLCNGIIGFDKKVKGFAMRSAVLTGPETRTSAPIRVTRDDETRLANGYVNMYPCGEGAGYAGGITSAAVDGLKTALSIISRYKPTRR